MTNILAKVWNAKNSGISPSIREEKLKENYVGGETTPTSIKEKDTSQKEKETVPYIYPHQQ